MSIVLRNMVLPDDLERLGHICSEACQWDDQNLACELYGVSYYEYCPDLCMLLVDDRDGSPLGFCSAAADLDGYIRWFTSEKLPRMVNPEKPEVLQHLEYLDFMFRYPARMHVYVLPDARYQGYGKRLVNALLGVLSSMDVPGVHMAVSPGSPHTVEFCRSMGFSLIAWREQLHYYGLGISVS